MRVIICLSFLAASAAVHGAQVIEVHDGDTLTVLEGGNRVQLRLASADAPELDQPYGKASRTALEDLCKGKAASYQREDKAAGGELFAFVVCDGIDAGRAQLKRGLAWVRPRPNADPSFTLIQDFVWRDKIGLWADANPVPPWEWAERKK